jgi:hypothetical protein
MGWMKIVLLIGSVWVLTCLTALWNVVEEMNREMRRFNDREEGKNAFIPMPPPSAVDRIDTAVRALSGGTKSTEIMKKHTGDDCD